MVERTFDWRPRHDPRSLQYGIREAVESLDIHDVTWRNPPLALNQGSEGACVGHAWVHEAQNTPIAVDFTETANTALPPQQLAFWVYEAAKDIDQWPGDDYAGTSVLAGAKVMQQLGLLNEYRWCFSVEDIRDALLTTGPVVLGVNWYDGMYQAPGGVLTVSGELVGGHSLIATAYRTPDKRFDDEPAFGLFNSWGPEFGLDGLCWISQSDLARLMAQSGEACVPVSRSYGRG